MGRNFNSVSCNNADCYCQSCFAKNVLLPLEVNESPMNGFYNNCNSTEVSFDDNNHHILINSKYFSVNEINALKTKESHFGILHLNIASLNKLIDGISNLLSLMKLRSQETLATIIIYCQ